MSSELFTEVKRFVEESFGGSDKHFDRTVYWLKRLQSDADDAMQIAAMAHDIARAFRKTSSAETFRDSELNDPEILREHQAKSAEIMKDFLEKRGVDDELIDRVYNMIRFHEEGGTPEADLIKDADSLSYLEVVAPKHLVLVEYLGKQKIKNKFYWMFTRISSNEARKFAERFYKSAMRALDKLG